MSRSLLLALVVLAGCFDDPRPRHGPRRDRHLLNPGAPRLADGAIPEGSPRVAPALADAPTLDELPADEPGLVVLVVLDGVRADHLSVCGYDRPTSPTLQRLVDKGASLTCRGVAPATWSLPSQATLLTGVLPEEHRMLRRGAALPVGVGTLADAMAAKGYQTLLVTSNPALRKGSELSRGFLAVHVGTEASMRGDGLVRAMRYELAQIDPKRPLFLYVDVGEAGEPFQAVPDGVPWAPAQPAVDPEASQAFAAGSLQGTERAAFLSSVRNGYDYGVLQADATLDLVAKTIERHELGRHGVRLVVTSDHGTALGEHGLVGQGGPPWEAATRVPVLLLDATQRDAMPTLPEPFPLTAVQSLLVTGRVPSPLPPARAVSTGPSPDDDSVAIWPTPTRKVLLRAGTVEAFDVVSYPGETAPLPATPEERAALDAALGRWRPITADARSSVEVSAPAPIERPRRRRR